jgi:CDP-diacylglycerol--glycerol-3-phosphate 3-phosphatidyltransferase
MKINLALKITFFRIILIPIILLILLVPINTKDYFYLFNIKIYIPYFIALLIFIVASLSDAIDGYVARSTNTVTTLGKFLDPVADKLLVNSVLIYLCSVNQIPVLVVIIMILRDMAVDALRLVAAQKNIVIAASILGKLKTIFQMVSICLVLLYAFPDTPLQPLVLYLVYFSTLISLLSGVNYFYKNKKVILD